uniref:non-specific serine/threonine protein kinase n=1 Tax=Denticeps clupeoides TaxID=299321 RepID=A0AAY4DBT7_9TELE
QTKSILRLTKHKNIVRMYDEFETRSGRLPEKQCQDMFHQMVQAVRYLHSNNISHRDLKCDNILLTHELSTTFCGTPCYLAPEVLQQKPYDPKKADIWSLGMVLYYMAIGAKPFNTSSVNALLKMQAAPLALPEFVASDVVDIL